MFIIEISAFWRGSTGLRVAAAVLTVAVVLGAARVTFRVAFRVAFLAGEDLVEDVFGDPSLRVVHFLCGFPARSL
jgi:hypothetical protein